MVGLMKQRDWCWRVLPFPPSINHYWRHSRNGTYISAEGKSFRRKVKLLCRGTEPLKGRLRVELQVTWPDRRRRDIDNIQKPVLDALEHAGVCADDSQIKDLRTVVVGVEKPGRVEVWVWEEEE